MSSSSALNNLRTYSSARSAASTSSSSSSSSSFSIADFPPTQTEFAQSELPCLHEDLHRIEREVHKSLSSILKIAQECTLQPLSMDNVQRCQEFLQEGDQIVTQLEAHTPVLNAVQQNMIHTPYKSKEDLAQDYNTQLDNYIAKSNQKPNPSSYSNQLSNFLMRHPTGPPQEDDITITQDDDPANFLCPLTGAPIEHLWIAGECGHPYDKETITEHLQSLPRNQRRTECLYSGCVHYISLNGFKKDEILEQRMKRNRLGRQRKEYERI